MPPHPSAWRGPFPHLLPCTATPATTMVFSNSLFWLGHVSSHFLTGNTYPGYFRKSSKKQCPTLFILCYIATLFHHTRSVFHNFSFKSSRLLPTSSLPSHSLLVLFIPQNNFQINQPYINPLLCPTGILWLHQHFFIPLLLSSHPVT